VIGFEKGRRYIYRLEIENREHLLETIKEETIKIIGK